MDFLDLIQNLTIGDILFVLSYAQSVNQEDNIDNLKKDNTCSKCLSYDHISLCPCEKGIHTSKSKCINNSIPIILSLSNPKKKTFEILGKEKIQEQINLIPNKYLDNDRYIRFFPDNSQNYLEGSLILFFSHDDRRLNGTLKLNFKISFRMVNSSNCSKNQEIVLTQEVQNLTSKTDIIWLSENSEFSSDDFVFQILAPDSRLILYLNQFPYSSDNMNYQVVGSFDCFTVPI